MPNGLAVLVRHATAGGSAALQVWIRCPSSGWDSGRPGLARLTALAVIGSSTDGTSLRDVARARGARLGISVFQTSTEFSVVAPAPAASMLAGELIRRVFHPTIDAASFADAKRRLAASQGAAEQSTPEALREAAFHALFPAGPMGVSTFGDAAIIETATLADVRFFAARSYVPSAAIVVAVGNLDAGAMQVRIAGAASTYAPGSSSPITGSTFAGGPPASIAVDARALEIPGVGLAWAGPPITDERAATAMDFLSDYLADERAGVLARAAPKNGDAAFAGQFVTLRERGVFFVTVTGAGVDPAAATTYLRDALAPVVSRPIPGDAFGRALHAYQARLLAQMDSAQGIADNYGWYFVEGAPAYAPSATDASLGGAYFETAASLDPGFVRAVARQYLGVDPVVVTARPTQATGSAGGGS